MMETQEKKYNLDALYINVTARCNLGCRHCWVNSGYLNKTERKNTELTPRGIISIIENALPLGLRTIKLTGGEPLLRNDLEYIYDFALKKDIRIIIETNATLINKKTARLLKKYKISFISASLDGYNASINDSFRGVKGAFAKAVKGIINLTEAGLLPQVITVLHRENAKNFVELTALFSSLGIKDVKINLISPIGKGNTIYKQKTGLTIKEVLHFRDGTLAAVKKKFSGRIILNLPPAFLDFKAAGIIKPCNIFGTLGILPNGYVSICGIGFSVKELLFGKLGFEGMELKEIWCHHKKLQELRQNLPDRLEGVCGQCIFKKACLGFCRAESYYRNKNFYSPFWFCQEAYKQGLFPETRLIKKEDLWRR